MGYKGPNQIVTPEEFRKRTALTFSARSGSTLAMDKAYDAYYANDSAANAKALYQALGAYVAAHGSYWNKCERNLVSGGLLEFIYEHVNPNKLSAAQSADLDRRAAERIRNIEIPSARLGVLYFLANIKVEMDPFQSTLESLSAVGGVVGVGMTTDIKQMGSAANGTRAVFTAPIVGAAVKAEPLALAGKLATKGGKLAVDKLMAPSDPSPAWSQRLPTTAAALTAMANAISSNYDAGRYRRMAGVAAMSLPVTAVALVADGVRTLWETIKSALSKVGDLIVSLWTRKGDLGAARTLGLLAKAAVKVAAELVWRNAIPFLGGAVDLGTGLARSIGDACSRIASWYDRRSLDLQAGHPAQIANALESQMSKGVFRGLAEALVGAAKAAVSVFLPGLGSLVSVVMAAIDWMIRIVSRLYEQSAIQNFLLEAQRLYVQEKTKVRQVDGVFAGTREGSLLKDTARFSAFFERGCNASPLIPMLTLNSGLAGNWMTTLSLFSGSDAAPDLKANAGQQVLTADQYFKRLKNFSVEYMRLSGFRFLPMMSHDTLMAGYLKHATGHGQAQGDSFVNSAGAFLRS